MRDFLAHDDTVDALVWAYRHFNFSACQPVNYRSPFWQAFRAVQSWPGAGVMWSNVCRSDYTVPEASGGGVSILRAPDDVLKDMIEAQAGLFADKLAILAPHVCLFFTGPYYDPVITGLLPGCILTACSDLPVRRMAQLTHPALPTKSFRTYHPNYLNRSGNWGYIDELRKRAGPPL